MLALYMLGSQEATEEACPTSKQSYHGLRTMLLGRSRLIRKESKLDLQAGFMGWVHSKEKRFPVSKGDGGIL